MWDKTDRAFDVMRERNRRYLEEQKKKVAEDPADGNGDSPQPQAEPSDEHERDREGDQEQEREQQLAEEKLRAYREANGLDPDAQIPEGVPPKPSPEEDSRDETRADEYRKRNAEPAKLEKGDVPAMILAAILVFGPIFLVLIGIYLLAWIFLH